jgi:ubiquitin C-terminal hydrolase
MSSHPITRTVYCRHSLSVRLALSRCHTGNNTNTTASSNSTNNSSNDPWLNFDDEFVEEIPASKVVSESAYVLFYRRRRLTAANVVNTTV